MFFYIYVVMPCTWRIKLYYLLFYKKEFKIIDFLRLIFVITSSSLFIVFNKERKKKKKKKRNTNHLHKDQPNLTKELDVWHGQVFYFNSMELLDYFNKAK